MAKTMKSVDAVLVGVGWSGSIMARELTKAGLTVVALERGAHRTPGEDFTIPSVRDELKYRVRLELMLDTAVETAEPEAFASGADMKAPPRSVLAFAGAA